MNKTRRKSIEKIIERISVLKDELEAVQNEEQEVFDALPESLQATANGAKMDSCIGYIENANDYLDEAVEYLNFCLE